MCRTHGGAAPQVQQKAKERLAALVDPAIERLGKLVRGKSPGIALGAINSVLDRNGFKPNAKVTETPDGGILLSWLSDDE